MNPKRCVHATFPMEPDTSPPKVEPSAIACPKPAWIAPTAGPATRGKLAAFCHPATRNGGGGEGGWEGPPSCLTRVLSVCPRELGSRKPNPGWDPHLLPRTVRVQKEEALHCTWAGLAQHLAGLG